MKLRLLVVALVAIATTFHVNARYKNNDTEEVRSCKRACPLRNRSACHAECERSMGANFIYGIADTPAAAVQTGTLGIIPTNRQAVEDYNIVKNTGRGIKRLGVDAGRIVTLGYVARGDEHETNF